MNKVIVIIFLLLSVKSFSQSATYQAFSAMSYYVDNNEFKLKSNPTKEIFGEKKSLIWNNVFFKYFKNPNFRLEPNPNKSMKFSITYEYFYRLYCAHDTTFIMNFSKGIEDKFLDVDVTLFVMEAGKVTSSKLKSKNYTLNKEDRKIELKLNQGLIQPGSILQLFVKIESANLKQLGLFSFAKPVSSDYSFLLTANIPSLFNYTFPKDIELKEEKTKKMLLKEFIPYSTPPIVDYEVDSYSYIWTIPTNQISSEIVLKLESINIEKKIGTNADSLLEDSK